MEQMQSQSHELKQRIPVWLYPSTLEVMDETLPGDNCKTRSEYIEKAIRFYTGYVSGQSAADFLPVALVAALQGTVQSSESRTARLLFKLAVEVAMMSKVLALGLEIDPRELERIRGQCVQEVKKTNGSISFKDAVEQVR